MDADNVEKRYSAGLVVDGIDLWCCPERREREHRCVTGGVVLDGEILLLSGVGQR